MPVIPLFATGHDAASDKPDLADCELALDETTEKLQAYFENSSSWLETVLLTVGFYLLSLAAKSPEEFEILGAKINVAGDHRELFLVLIGMALVFRLVQSWMMSKLHTYRIGRSFDQVRVRLGAARELLIVRVNENEKLMYEFIDEVHGAGNLPDPSNLFEDEGMQLLIDAANVRGAPLTVHTFRQALADKFLSRRNDLVERHLEDRYPIEVWNRAADAAIAESLVSHAFNLLPQAYIFSEGEDAAPTIPAKERVRLMRGKEAAFENLRKAMDEQPAKYQERLRRSTEELQGIAAKMAEVLGKVRFYRRAAKGGYFVQLTLPTLAALLSAVAVVMNRY